MSARPLRPIVLTFGTIVILGIGAAQASAQSPPKIEATTDVITAAPIAGFSERSGLWPATVLAAPNSENETLERSLNSTSGVQARINGSPTVSIRGSGSSDRVLQLFEGVPLNLGDGIGASSLFKPAEAIGSIMLFKGPASAFYGNSAMAGAVDYRLRRFERAAVRFGLGTNKNSIDDQNIFAVAPFSSSQITGLYHHQTGHYPYSSASGLGSGVRSNNQQEVSRATYAGDYKWGAVAVRPRFILATSVGELPGPLNQPYVNSFDYSGLLSSVELSRRLGEQSGASLRFSDIRQWGLYDRDTLIQSTSFTERSLVSGDYRTQLFSNTVSRTFADARWDRLNARYLSDAQLTQFDFELGEGLEISLSPMLSLQPVVRYRAESGDFLKSLALVRAGVKEDREWLTYSEGYRAASLSDRFSNLSYFKGNPGLQSERSRALELGSEILPFENLQLGATVFAIRYDQLFDTASVGPLATQKINAGRARAIGAEIFSTYKIGADSVRASYSYLDAKNEDSSEILRLSPTHQYSFSAQHAWSFATLEFKTTTWSTYIDRESPSNALEQLPGWTVCDLNLQSTSLKDWELKAGVLNLFDVPRELTYAYPEAQMRAYLSVLRFL